MIEPFCVQRESDPMVLTSNQMSGRNPEYDPADKKGGVIWAGMGLRAESF